MSGRDEPTDWHLFQRWLSVDVRYRDFDTQGHVNNATYFTYLEQARVLFLYELRDHTANAIPHASQGGGDLTDGANGGAEAEAETVNMSPAVPFVIATASCVYRRPITKMEPLAIGIRCEAPRRASFELRYVICDAPGGLLYASASTVVVSVNPTTGHPRTLPSATRATIGRMRAETARESDT